MGLKELQSSLDSLKQLYGLLQNGLSDSVSVTLDDKSRLLLKDLLDSAVGNVFDIYSKKGEISLESPSNSEESDSTFHDCISSGSELADDSLNKLADVRQLTKQTAHQNACRSYLSKQASVAIQQIDELSYRMKPESARNMGKQHRYYARKSDQMNRRIHKDPPRSKNIRAFDSRDKVDEYLGNHRKEGLSREVPHKARRRSQRQHESDASLSSSSSCETQQWTPTSSGSAKYSLSGDGIQEFSASCSDDNSWVSGDEPYASTSGSYYSGDDETEGHSKPRRQHRRQPRVSTKRMRPRRVDASSKWKKLGKKTGGWNKLKSVIFPNHHHHHLHSNADEFSRSENRKARGKKVPSKHIAKRSPFPKPNAIGRQAVQKIENAMDSKLVQKPVNAIRGLFKRAKSKLPLRVSRHGKTKMLPSQKKKAKKLRPGFKKRK